MSDSTGAYSEENLRKYAPNYQGPYVRPPKSEDESEGTPYEETYAADTYAQQVREASESFDNLPEWDDPKTLSEIRDESQEALKNLGEGLSAEFLLYGDKKVIFISNGHTFMPSDGTWGGWAWDLFLNHAYGEGAFNHGKITKTHEGISLKYPHGRIVVTELDTGGLMEDEFKAAIRDLPSEKHISYNEADE